MNASGSTVRLLGVDRSGTEYMCYHGWGFFDGPSDQASIQAMLSWHINAVRVPLNEDCWLGINGVPTADGGAAYQQAIASYVAALTSSGLYVVLDLHVNAPGSTLATTQQDMADADHAPAFWTGVASTFKSNGNVAFDLYNEPHGVSWNCWLNGGGTSSSPCQGAPFAVAGMQTLVNTVRHAGAHNLLLVGGLGWANDLSSWLTYQPHDPDSNMAAAWHTYVNGQYASGCRDQSCWNTTIAPLATHVPIVAGEVGEGDCSHTTIDPFYSWMDAHSVSYIGWAWNAGQDCATFPALITDWHGTPSAYGQGLHDHLAALADQGPSPPPRYTFGVEGGVTTTHLGDDRAAGITAKVVRLSWADLMSGDGVVNETYVQQKQAEIQTLRQAGFSLQVDLGLQNPPAWVHQEYPDSSLVDQYGDTYVGGVDGGDANLIWNPHIRALGTQYIKAIFDNFGTNFSTFRLGGGHWGELGYPTASYNGHANTYWGFDAAALASDPVPSWRPGQPSPNGEAAHFLTWYLHQIIDYQTWQIETVRQYYGGTLQILYPGFGMRSDSAAAAVAGDLGGTTSPEINGEVQTAHDFAGQVAAITDPNVQPYTTWLDCPYGNDASADPTQWSPVKTLVTAAHIHRPALSLSGENTGNGSYNAMQFAAAQMKIYGLAGMNWAFDDSLYTGSSATIANYQSTIVAQQ